MDSKKYFYNDYYPQSDSNLKARLRYRSFDPRLGTYGRQLKICKHSSLVRKGIEEDAAAEFKNFKIEFLY